MSVLPLMLLPRGPRGALIAGVWAALTVIPCAAHAQPFAERFVLRGEVGAGTMLAGFQRDTLGYRADVQGSGRLGFTLLDPLALQVSFSSWWFPAPTAQGRADGQQYTVSGGLRLEPKIGEVGRLFLDGNVGLGITGDAQRLAVDAGLGFEFALGRAFGLGPVVRYGRLMAQASAQDFPSDAQYWSAGLSLSARIPSARPDAPGPTDTDRDGVFDPEDECPTEPSGMTPDAQHRGCPTRDRDRDGVSDGADVCPDDAQGERPDPTRRGCAASDTDRDGVYDLQDLCATTPQGPHPDPARAGCPDGDDDADGVLNSADPCRTEVQGLHPDPARPGCPLADRDHDTVPDATDACPDVVGAPSLNPRRDGCPGLVVVRDGMIVILRPVFFATNRDRILAPSFPVLTAIVTALRAQPQIRRIGVEGHTDNVGGEADNAALSQRRAQAVAAWFVQHGIEAGRVEAHGYGAARPIVPNDSASGRAANRRVEFRILDPLSVAADAMPGRAP